MRVTTAGGSADIYYGPGQTLGRGQGGRSAPTIEQHGTHYRWRLALG